MQRGAYKAKTGDNSQRIDEHLHCCDEEENQDTAAEGGAAPLFPFGGEVLLKIGVHKAQRHDVDLSIFHSVRTVIDGRLENVHDRAEVSFK